MNPAVILILATAQTVVILMGAIDLSMTAVASLASVLIALALPTIGPGGLVGVLALTTLIGAVQGLIHTRAQMPSFIVTLAGLGAWSGLALTIAQTTIPVAAGYSAVGWLERNSYRRPEFIQRCAGCPCGSRRGAASPAVRSACLRDRHG